jgi:hypothetical protein
MYAKSKDKKAIESLNEAIHQRLQEIGKSRYIAENWAVLQQDIDDDWFIPVIIIVDIPDGVEIVETIELKEEDIELK